MAGKIQIRRDVAANWTSVNPILADGEFGYEKDTGSIKIGNGIDEWNLLEYRFTGGGGGTWGSITGTLTDQTDLNDALEELQAQINAGNSGNKLFNYYNFI